MIAAVRPDDWNLPLLIHVGGAMLLVGSLVTVAGLLVVGRGTGNAALMRPAFKTSALATSHPTSERC